MSFKKRGNGSWTDTPNYIMGTSTDTITTLPTDIYPTGTTATVGLKGNMEQSGTPTPTTPIQPQETGERTGNLFPFDDKNFVITVGKSNLTVECKNGNLFFQGNAGEISSSQGVWKNNFAFELEAGTYYCNSPAPLGQGFGRYIKKYDDNTNILTTNNYTFTLSEKTKCYLSFYIYQKTLDTKIELMLNTGSTPLPYEPYGYKAPISSAGQTTTVYLGEVETTRRIKKLVLTGEETFYRDKERAGSWRFYSNPLISAKSNVSICSHFAYIGADQVNESDTIGFSLFSAAQFGCRCPKEIANTITEFKAFLAAQYAAGTPVIVWYILATETTGIVNEPLRKIGNYADEVSGITIPTITGANTIDVDTTLKPSEVSVNYKGWHSTQSLHKFNGTSWD